METYTNEFNNGFNASALQKAITTFEGGVTFNIPTMGNSAPVADSLTSHSVTVTVTPSPIEASEVVDVERFSNEPDYREGVYAKLRASVNEQRDTLIIAALDAATAETVNLPNGELDKVGIFKVAQAMNAALLEPTDRVLVADFEKVLKKNVTAIADASEESEKNGVLIGKLVFRHGSNGYAFTKSQVASFVPQQPDIAVEANNVKVTVLYGVRVMHGPIIIFH